GGSSGASRGLFGSSRSDSNGTLMLFLRNVSTGASLGRVLLHTAKMEHVLSLCHNCDMFGRCRPVEALRSADLADRRRPARKAVLEDEEAVYTPRPAVPGPRDPRELARIEVRRPRPLHQLRGASRGFLHRLRARPP